jgi:CDP-paratose 2-epimerase
VLDSPFVYMSTNKVYGDAPNELPLRELETRWEYARPQDYGGIREDFRVDRSKHSIFGASKLAADVMVQEYGRYFGMHTCCLRGGCLTGPSHSGVELHGFLSYLVKVNVTGGTYKVFGYKGKQVRDNIHAHDVACLIQRFLAQPRSGEVYNLGGGRGNSCSILEAFEIVRAVTGRKMQFEYLPQNREGDHICYISDLSKLQQHYPGWGITRSLQNIFEETVRAWHGRQ